MNPPPRAFRDLREEVRDGKDSRRLPEDLSATWSLDMISIAGSGEYSRANKVPSLGLKFKESSLTFFS